MNLVELVADSALRDEVISAERGYEPVCRSLQDTFGSLVGGTTESLTRKMRGLVSGYDGSGGSCIVGMPIHVSAPIAALHNSAAGHALCFDDTSETAMNHPSIVVLPAVLALAEERGASGLELVEAYIAGVETAVRIGALAAPQHYLAGWHATGTTGVVGAAAGAARLLRLDRDATKRALNLSASAASGFRTNFGSEAMIYHAGQASRAGVESALLAERGVTTGVDAFGGDKGYFALLGAPVPDPRDPDVLRLFEEAHAFGKAGLDVKPYPCGALSHRAVQAVLSLRQDFGVDPGDILNIDCTIPELHSNVLVHTDPKSVLEARISLVYPIAVAALNGSCGLDDFSEELIHSEDVRRMMALVRVQTSGEVESSVSVFGAPVTVSIRLRRGGQLERTIEVVKGSAGAPLSDEEADYKWRSSVDRILGRRASGELCKAVAILHRLADLSAISSLLRGVV